METVSFLSIDYVIGLISKLALKSENGFYAKILPYFYRITQQKNIDTVAVAFVLIQTFSPNVPYFFERFDGKN